MFLVPVKWKLLSTRLVYGAKYSLTEKFNVKQISVNFDFWNVFLLKFEGRIHFVEKSFDVIISRFFMINLATTSFNQTEYSEKTTILKGHVITNNLNRKPPDKCEYTHKPALKIGLNH